MIGFIRQRPKAAMYATSAILGCLTLLALSSVDSAFAQQTSTVFTNLQNKATDLFYNARSIILILCALAIVATMATAISGRFPFGKALGIVGAVVVIGLASEIVTYFASATQSGASGTTANGWQSLTDTSSSSP